MMYSNNNPDRCICITDMARHRCPYNQDLSGCHTPNNRNFQTDKTETMDHFLFATNPLKPPFSLGHQGYIIDTVKNTWIQVRIEEPTHAGGEETHYLNLVKSTGNEQQDLISCHRAARWYNSWLIQRGLQVMVRVSIYPSTGKP